MLVHHRKRHVARSFAVPATLALVLLSLGASRVAAHPQPRVPPQAGDSLTLTSAPVQLLVPADRGQWARRLGLFGDAAAAAYSTILGMPVPAGTIRWAPDPLSAQQTDATIAVSRGPSGTVLEFTDPFSILTEDFGVAFAQGYARWLMAYSLARLYFIDGNDPDIWWADGAALYMTELLARREHATTPILYNLEAAYSRAARGGDGVGLTGEARAASGNAARGKSLATFRLFEALYGEAAVTALLVALARAPGGDDIAVTVLASLPANAEPSPQAVLDTWLEPTSSINLGIRNVEVIESGTKIRGRVSRRGDVPTRSRIEVRLASGELLYADIPPGTDVASWELDITDVAVEVRVDPGGLLPDIDRSDNRYGFGNADRIRQFFPLDEQLEVGELHFDGNIEQVGRKRAENFSVTLRNLTDEPFGLGLLVSAQWLDRPATRSQRRIFVMLPPGQRVIARDFIEFPRRGSGRARVEARYWRADDPEALNNRLLRDPADLLNSYLILRQPAQTTGPDGTPLERLNEEFSITPVASLAIAGGGEQLAGAADGPTVDEAPAVPSTADDFAVRIVGPPANATPLGDMNFTVVVDGPPASVIELYVNSELVGRGQGGSARATFNAGDDENVFLLQALALGADGEVATDTQLLQRGTIGFGVSVDLVTLNVTVREPGGGFVEDLSAEDFRLTEDGVAQEVVSFAKGEDTPVSAAILVDTSSSMIGGGITSARAGANRLLDTLLRGNDRAMVLGFNSRLYMYADFTNDLTALREAIAATEPDGATSLYDAVVESLRKVNRRVGRRALIVLSDGLDVHSQFGFADVLEYTRQSDVLVYTIGLQLMHDATDLGDASDTVKKSVENLTQLAEVTGGSAYFPLRLDELEAVYSEIAAELESQYSVSYYPTNQNWDGEWRELQVGLVNSAGQVQARPGYYGVRPRERR